MKFDNRHPTNEFLDSLSSHLFLLHTTHPTRVRDPSKILIHGIFSIDNISQLPIMINLTATKSDHLPQFIVLQNIFCNPPINKPNIYERYCFHFVQENSILD